MTYIYALKDGDKVFYVGQTENLKLRLRGHLHEATFRDGTKDVYIREMLERGVVPTIHVLAECLDAEADIEELFYIGQYADLCNHHGTSKPHSAKEAIPNTKCPRSKCGYEWFARVSKPKQCPRCKQPIKRMEER